MKIDIDALSNYIRQIDGNNRMGAGVLAEKIAEYLNQSPAIEPAQVVPQHVIEASNRIPQNIIESPQAVPVAEVVWYDPRLTHPDSKRAPHKIIDASLTFFDEAPVGTKLYTAPPAIDDETCKMALLIREAVNKGIFQGAIRRDAISILSRLTIFHGGENDSSR